MSILLTRYLYLKALWFDAGPWLARGSFPGQPVGLVAVENAQRVAAMEAAHPAIFNAYPVMEPS
jgi:hypothetical protein